MSDYFDRVGLELRAAMEHGAHRTWHARMSSRARGMGRRGRGLAFVIAALVIATPAVGAASNWFRFGSPQHFAGHSPGIGIGTVTPGTSRLTALRVPDPNGGPPWGLRVVQTTRGDTCLQIGRVENGQLGSLGSDGAWHDDGLFHPFPKNSETPDCTITDAAGHGFVNSSDTGQVANGQPVGNRAPGCRANSFVGRRACPPGTVRIVFMGLLGPDATSVTYKAPDGKLTTEPTVGPDGAYLLVFVENTKTCSLYASDRYGSVGPCPGEQEGGSPSPSLVGAIKRVDYRDGHTCRLGNRKGPVPSPCPPVGFVAFKPSHLTSSDVAAPIKVRAVTGKRFCAPKSADPPNTFSWIRCAETVPHGDVRINLTADDTAGVVLADVSFTARQPVTSSRSEYTWAYTDPSGCHGGGGGGQISRGNVARGATLRFQTDAALSDCHGIYRGTVVYVEYTDPTTQQVPVSLFLGDRGLLHKPKGIKLLTVGHFSYRVP